MPVIHTLIEDGQVMHFELRDPWTMEELFKGFAEATSIRDAVHQQNPTRRVHTLMDLMATTNPPPQVMQGRNFPGLTHATRGEIVVAVKDEFPRSIARAMLKGMHAEGHFFVSLEEAQAYLRTLTQKTPTPGETDSKA